MTTPIARPNVRVVQDLTASRPTTFSPLLQTVLVGPLFQVVDAFDDDQVAQSDALAGIYRDGQGVISYDVPSLVDGASTVGLESEASCWLVYGTTKRRLHGVADEQTVMADREATTIADLDGTTVRLTEAGANFVQRGVIDGDCVRVSYLGVAYDIPISTLPTSDNYVEFLLADSPYPTGVSLSAVDYAIVRTPAEFVLRNKTNAIGVINKSGTQYLTFEAKSTGNYAGAAGEGLEVELKASPATVSYSGNTGLACGDIVLYASGETFVTDDAIPFSTTTRAVSADDTWYVIWTGDGATTRRLYEVSHVVAETVLLVATGSGAKTAANFALLESEDTGTDGAVTSNTTLSAASGAFTDDATHYVEIRSADGATIHGVWAAEYVSSTSLTLTGGGATNGTGLRWRYLNSVNTGTATTKSDRTQVAAVGGGLTGHASKYLTMIDADGAPSTKVISAVTNDHLATTAAFGSGYAGAVRVGEVVPATSSLSITWDATVPKITFTLARASGETSSTMTEVRAALVTSSNPAYNATAAAAVTASLTGTYTFTEADMWGTGAQEGSRKVWSTSLDGGNDDHALVLDADLLGSTSPTANVYLSYRALRTDKSSAPVTVSNVADLRALGEAVPENPLVLAASIALANSPTRDLLILGVNEVSDAAPNGTLEAYQDALDVLAPRQVHCIVPLTLDPAVTSLVASHVTTLSAAAGAPVRIGIVSSTYPAFTTATVIASGTQGNTETVSGISGAVFTGDANFALAEAESGDILVISSLAAQADYLSGVDGTQGPLYGAEITGVVDGDDFALAFDGTDFASAWDNLVDVTWTLYRPGTAISSLSDAAQAIADVSESFANRRIIHVPGTLLWSINGSPQQLEGFYAAAMVGGALNVVPPQKPLTGWGFAGASGIQKTNDTFTDAQMDLIAGGGTFLLIQESASGPVRCRHGLTTDVSSAVRQHVSVTRALDYISKDLAAALKPLAGPNNLTDELLGEINLAAEARLAQYRLSKLCQDAQLVSLRSEGTQIFLDINVQMYLPGDYITITIQVA